MQDNFSDISTQKQTRSNITLLVLLSAVFVVMVLEYQQNRIDIETLELALSEPQAQKKIKIPLTEATIQNSQLANKIHQQLSFPWQSLFDVLETVKKSQKQVQYKSIKPDVSSSELLLVAQAKSIEAMLNFVETFQRQQYFQYVFILNQHQAKEGNIEFTLKLGWQHA
jgi:ABC-type anion transport system duplicated permease subunit